MTSEADVLELLNDIHSKPRGRAVIRSDRLVAAGLGRARRRLLVEVDANPRNLPTLDPRDVEQPDLLEVEATHRAVGVHPQLEQELVCKDIRTDDLHGSQLDELGDLIPQEAA